MGFINDFRNVSRMALMVAFAAAMVGIIYGYDQSNIAGALHFMQAQDVFGLGQVLPECANGACEKLTSTALERQGLTASMVVIGMLFGALFGGPLSNKIGRKPAMIGVAVTFALFSVFSGVAWSFEALLVARTLLGLTVGVSLVVVPVFVAESAPTKVRGAMLDSLPVCDGLRNHLRLPGGLVARRHPKLAIDAGACRCPVSDRCGVAAQDPGDCPLLDHAGPSGRGSEGAGRTRSRC